MRPLLRQWVLTGLVGTTDAQVTQPDLATAICARGGEYVRRVKGNLLQDVRTLLSPAHYDVQRRHSITAYEQWHGRTERRTLITHALTQPIKKALGWPSAQ